MAPAFLTRYPSHRTARHAFRLLCLGGLLALTQSIASAEPRVWTSWDGKTVTAELISATETTVTIKTDAGREFTLPHERLSQADVEVIQAHLAKKKAEYADVVWPKPNGEDAIDAPLFKKLHTLDTKKFNATYAGRVLTLEGHVLDVKEDRTSAAQGVIVVLDTEDKVAIEMKLSKSSYEKDITTLLGPGSNRFRNPYDEEAFRTSVVDKCLVVERRYVVSRDNYYYDNTNSWRYRNKWSDWEVVARPIVRGESVKLRGEFVSVFNSAMTFRDANLAPAAASPRRTVSRP